MKKAVKKIAHKEPGIREDIRRIIAIVEMMNKKIDVFLKKWNIIKKPL